MSYQLLFCTCPDKLTAEHIARLLVEQQLAACVNILPNVTSVYRWQHQIEQAEEVLLLIKAREGFYTELEQAIKAHHPYEVPEIIALRIERGLPDYLQWIDSCHTSN
ncbi:Divalent-cation tolerance protein CutA [uncultured bacterium]|nr:Divalent-cation tolerance protein CutA [uncultured bacterium]